MTTLLDEIADGRAKLQQAELSLTDALDVIFHLRDQMESWERGLAQPLERWLRYPLPTVFPITSKFHDPPIPGVRSTIHEGTDFGCPAGVAVLAGYGGKVLTAHFNSCYGYRAQIEHSYAGEMWETWYCHLSQLRVVPGQSVIMGQCVGLSGATGNVTGAHLHWNVVRKSNKTKIDGLVEILRGCEDPMDWVILPA